MDVRGIEVTNQLRSAIRAKLLELGVRYDEELPDYILVMVVNKKTRQQMHEDLHLFLEDSTTPFVEWLHDQVLKKLQKVTIAKKKTSREFVPSIVVKQEEERKKRKNANAIIDEKPENIQKILQVPTKEEKSQKIIEKSSNSSVTITNEKLNDISASIGENSSAIICETEKITSTKENESIVELSTGKPKNMENVEITLEKKMAESREKITAKRPLESSEETAERPEKRIKSLEKKVENFKDQKNEEEEEEEEDEKEEEEEENVGEKRLKSCINKPKITSVVSVKNRLGVVSPRKKFETHRGHELKNSRCEKNLADSSARNRNQRLKNFTEDHSRYNDARNRPTINETRNLVRRDEKFRNNEKNIKERLGVGKNFVSLKKNSNEQQTMRCTIKNRLGPMKNNFGTVRNFFVPREREKIRPDDDDSVGNDDHDDNDGPEDNASIVNVGPVKSRIIAVNRPEVMAKRKFFGKNFDKNEIYDKNDDNDETESGKTIASKVIVTPRPLKPLQPNQKRATQSLLLRAVAEANQSVVKQKNPEPVLTEKIPKLKRLRQTGTREIGKNLSVHLNASKRLVMEKIQVQLSTADNEDNIKSKEYSSHPVNEEHMGVVMSLFQRSDDNQKFLVTLNGYNNNVVKEKSLSEEEVGEEGEEEEEEEERLDMEVTEDDEILLSNVPNELSEINDLSPTASEIIESEPDNESREKIIIDDENNENKNIVNVEKMEKKMGDRKKRKLSPIVYTRSRSRSPAVVATKIIPTTSTKDTMEKKIGNCSEKCRDKCRYWPNCTLGTKCSYYHPAVPCSAFPACKFGEKCAYKHPKCKFGLACTKLGCSFSHPKKQCKYHPFCTKPTCPYSHPPSHILVPAETTRAKFTWKRQE